MKTVKLLLMLALFSVCTIDAVWYKPWTWFSHTENGELTNDEVQYNQFD